MEAPPPKKARGKAKAKAKGRAARATSMYEVFSYDKSTAIDVYDVCPLSADRVMDTPFILTAVPSIMEKLLALKEPSADAPDATKVYQELTSFHEKFAKSDLRFTTGKAQRPMKEAVGQVVSTALRGSLSGHEVVDAGHWLPPSCYATIGKHRAIQYEVSGISNLRFCYNGERLLPVIA